MKHSYIITGMTCQNCVASVTEKLSEVDGVRRVDVDLDKGEATIEMQKHVSLDRLKSALPNKYTIEEKNGDVYDSNTHGYENQIEAKSKWQQLKPLFLIFAYLFATAILLNYKDWSVGEAMLDFMGLFYIVFSFFKFLDLKGFPESFRMYDPLAKAIPFYGWIYPFLELALGLLFLMRFQVQIALVATILILGITTFGVTKTLLDKKSIRCACLGTALKLPMTEATFIENTIMLVMAIFILVQ
jgi:copper chaperone CopZ